MNKSELVAIAKDYLANTPYGIMDFLGKEIIVLPTVFPPDLNTTYLCKVVEEITSKFIQKKSNVVYLKWVWEQVLLLCQLPKCQE